jgi:hypothetical protein
MTSKERLREMPFNKVAVSLLPLIMGATLLILTGCSSRLPPGVETVYKEGELDAGKFIEGGVVLAGVVVAEGVELNLFPDLPAELEHSDHLKQAYYWNPQVVRALRGAHADLRVVPFSQLRVTLAEKTVLRLLERHAQRSHPRPGFWNELRHVEIPVRYLLLARIERDELELDSTKAMNHLGPQKDALGRVPDEKPYGNDLKPGLNPVILRHVELNLELYDIKTGRSVWEAWVKRLGEKRIEAHTPQSGVKFKVVDRPDGTQAIRATDRIEDAPPFAPVLDDCLEVLIAQLLRARAGEENKGKGL